MDMEAGKTLTNEEVIRELLDLLKKNAMKEQANDVFEICSYVDGLEKKIDSMTEELTNMQNQIKEMQEDTLVNNAKKALSEAQERLNTRCEQIKSQVLEVKEHVRSTAKGIVEEAKEKGRAALYRVSEFLGIKKRLLDIRENVRDVRLKIETVKDADEKEWIGVFTSSEEMHKGSAGNVQMNQSIESILRLALNWEQVNGIVINPFGKYIQMTKKMIELLINGYEYYENERKSKDDENN